MEAIKFIEQRKDWMKIWDFHFPIWFLDRLINVHLNFSDHLGYENKNAIHIFRNGSEEAFFLDQEIKSLEKIRRQKIMSTDYMEEHYRNAHIAIDKLNSFLNKKSDNLTVSFFEYTLLLENLLSYYRSSRPEIFEIVETILKDKQTNSKEKLYLRNLIKKYGKLRLDIKKCWLAAEKKSIKMKIKIAGDLALHLEELEYLTNEEIELFIRKKNVSKLKKLIKERRHCIFGIVNGKKILITKRKQFDKISILLKTKIILKQNEIFGKIANKGYVKGKVRLIPQTNYNEMINRAKIFKKGEILVTGMTQPDIMFACRMATAIITDEGGITSHAAIISRELKIPCIIGTKIATKALKDGQLIEVDANLGIVRILKK